MTAVARTRRCGGLAALVALGAPGCLLDLPPPADGPCGFGARPCGTRCVDEQLACEPDDFAGSYVILLIAGDNDCFDDWDTGAVAIAEAEVVQLGAEVGVTVTGIAGGVFALVFGGEPVFTGEVEGDVLAATFNGAFASSEASCTWTWRSRLEMTAQDPDVEGRVTYRPQTNGHPSCAEIRPDCRSAQTLIAVRNPDPD